MYTNYQWGVLQELRWTFVSRWGRSGRVLVRCSVRLLISRDLICSEARRARNYTHEQGPCYKTQAKRFLILYVPCIVWWSVCRTTFTCTNCVLHTSSIHQHVSAHHTCHQQGIFVVLIIPLSNHSLYRCEFIHLSYNGPF